MEQTYYPRQFGKTKVAAASAPIADDVQTQGVLTIDDLPPRYTGRRSSRLAARRLAVAELRRQGASRTEARRMIHAPSSDAAIRQARATRLLGRRIAVAWGIKRQRKEKP